MATSVDWSKGEQTALVSIGTHNLSLTSYGPDRQAGEQVVACIPGLASSTKAWVTIIRLLKPHLRSYTYDRSGFGLSENSPLPSTSTNIAHELDLLLKAAPIAPPYIFIAHSWGGILVREFLQIQKDNGIEPGKIASLVMLDTNHDEMEEPLLGDSPVVIIASAEPHLDFQQTYDAGLAAGNGTEEECAEVSKMLKTWEATHVRLQKEQPALSRRTRYVEMMTGHNIHEIMPKEVVDEVIWVLAGGKTT